MAQRILIVVAPLATKVAVDLSKFEVATQTLENEIGKFTQYGKTIVSQLVLVSNINKFACSKYGRRAKNTKAAYSRGWNTEMEGMCSIGAYYEEKKHDC